jgi:flagellar basal body-associated protein FliL
MLGFLYLGMPLMLAYIGYLVHDYDIAKRRATELMDRVTNLTGTSVLYELPRVSMSMSSGVLGKSGMMKLDIGIEVRKDEVTRVQDYEPRIVDRILGFMHKQDFEKLKEPSSAHWVRKGLEDAIANGAIPIHIASVVVNRMVFE